MKQLVLLAVLVLAGRGRALKCYSCRSQRPIPSAHVTVSLEKTLKRFPPCNEFDQWYMEHNTEFIQTCPPNENKSCIKVTDPHDSTNVMRSCWVAGRSRLLVETGYNCDYQSDNGECYCETDLCNATGRGWPSVAVLLSALVIGLLASR